ncbi:hypothetical protein [Parazoarcus communis]|nr:hypothetical protein [Parazoarcus communis]NMG72717.1 hypothetical protein [Parazoarcus communis SWub3 = DSM 12120]
MFSVDSSPARNGGRFVFWTSLFGPAALALVIYLIFTPALPGIVHFDDRANLSGLRTISDATSAIQWIQGGIAGPLGRPISMATFALQHDLWPEPTEFLAWNIAFHSINALLALWLFLLIGNRLHISNPTNLSIAWMAALIWASMPLLNSTVFFLVQRMSLLSTTWILVGLISYLKLRGAANAGWHRQWIALGAIALAGALSILSKESGALIVAYALILEAGILHFASVRRPGLTFWVLASACLVLLGLLFRHAIWGQCTEIARGFDVWQRLGSQGLILMVYIKGLVLPTLGELNPFRFQNIGEYGDALHVGLPIWAGLMLSPWVMWRLGWRLTALAAAWFFFGHLMESGWVALEPYFAHRNYLPALLPTFAIVGWVHCSSGPIRTKRIGLILYAVVIATVTWMNASLWGDRELAAEIWAKEQPGSTRAALNLAYVLDDRYGLAQAQAYLDHVLLNERDSTGLRLQRLLSACQTNPNNDHSQLVQDVLWSISNLAYEGWSTDILEHLAATIGRRPCTGVTHESLAQIASAYLQQEAYTCSPAISHNMLMLIGLAAYREGDLDSALHFWLEALNYTKSFSTVGFVLEAAVTQNDHESITALLRLIKGASKPNAVSQQEWHDLISRVEEAEMRLRPLSATPIIDEVESSTQ